MAPSVLAQGFVATEPLHANPSEGLSFGLPKLVTPLMSQNAKAISSIRPRSRPADWPHGANAAPIAAPTVAPKAQPLPEFDSLTVAQEPAILLPQEQSAPSTPEAPVALKPSARPLKSLPTADYHPADFLSKKLHLQNIWANSEQAPRLAAALDLTQLYMAHMLLPEARDFHNTARAEGVQNHAELYEKWRVQAVMLDVLQQKPVSEDIPEGWPEASLWALSSQSNPARFGGDIDLLKAVSALQDHSEPVISQILPLLFNKAIAMGDLKIADGLLRGAKDATRLYRQPVYFYMRGRLAMAYGARQEAFDQFALAAQGNDLSAQRARIAMADIAIERKDPKLFPALRDILLEGVEQWRHGREGLILRARLAQVAEDLGDIPLALDIMGRIRQDHPNTPEAVLAHERGALALAAFAVAVDAEEISLETYLLSLRRVEAFYRLDPVWPIARAALARALSRNGLHEAAASEYTALRMDLLRLGAPEPIERVRGAIPLAEAAENLVNHNIARARQALAIDGQPKHPDLTERYHLAALGAGLPAALNELPNDPKGLFDYAQLARQLGDLDRASQAHRVLADRELLSNDVAEALEASLLAHHRDDQGFAAAGFFALRKTEKGAQSTVTPPIFEALVTPMPTLAPLSRAKSEEMLTRAQDSLDEARKILIQPLPHINGAALTTDTSIERPQR